MSPPFTQCSGQAAPRPKRGQQLFGENGHQNGSMNKSTARGRGKVKKVVNWSMGLPGRIRSPQTVESQSAMQIWFFSAEGSSNFTTETSETGTVQAPSFTLLKPMELRQPATLSQTHPRSTGSKLPPFTCFPFFQLPRLLKRLPFWNVTNV